MGTDLRLGLNLGYWQRDADDATELVQAAERLGYESVWTAEAYGSDAFTPLAWYGARTSRIKLGTSVAQISARSPAATAMTAMTLDHLTGGRLLLGIGASGPQVVEGWYGAPFPKPLARTREYVDLMRRIWRREEPVTSDGEHYPLPYPGGANLGKPLKLITRPLRAEIPLYLGAEGPKNVALATEIADGWLPLFAFPERIERMYGPSLAAAGPDFDIAAMVLTLVTDDVRAALDGVKAMLTLYIGGMGAESRNFHADIIGRMGYAETAREVQALYLAGRRDAAFAAIPDELADGISLVGPAGRIRERLEPWRRSPVTSLLVMGPRDERSLRTIRDLVLG
ncbi:F420-dependent oxidoreductase-like protein [Streptosporangium becharense]|uniref:F420-dependent oxidoreductase-like protein n=1 Tax=Streptosporangium becharense TaxID=1816182 RepID=A0A7W9MIG4_9ACTN|nr:LLM class F420-dependent oxidoreductase [Streptosporangium becharense]MBB2910977.1 F420-dependent oxidoreductase-like protein [Streptosporangium becharense]MBB5821965.1 F420-dependent oxidoreductase-like protein [Streptosporangium becharense]